MEYTIRFLRNLHIKAKKIRENCVNNAGIGLRYFFEIPMRFEDCSFGLMSVS